jgi:hypothetical protein
VPRIPGLQVAARLRLAERHGTFRRLFDARCTCGIRGNARSSQQTDGAAKRGRGSSWITLSPGRGMVRQESRIFGFGAGHIISCMLAGALVPRTSRQRSRFGAREHDLPRPTKRRAERISIKLEFVRGEAVRLPRRVRGDAAAGARRRVRGGGPRFWSRQLGEQCGRPKPDAESWDGLRRAG